MDIPLKNWIAFGAVVVVLVVCVIYVMNDNRRHRLAGTEKRGPNRVAFSADGPATKPVPQQKKEPMPILRVKGVRAIDSGGSAAIMMGIGMLVMVVAVIFEGSAIRLAAWGAIWTGWNVFWGVAILSQFRTDYLVFREPPDQ